MPHSHAPGEGESYDEAIASFEIEGIDNVRQLIAQDLLQEPRKRWAKEWVLAKDKDAERARQIAQQELAASRTESRRQFLIAQFITGLASLAAIVATIVAVLSVAPKRDFRLTLIQGNTDPQLGIGTRFIIVNAGNRTEALYDLRLAYTDPQHLEAGTLLRVGTTGTSGPTVWGLGPRVLKPGDVIVDSLWAPFPDSASTLVRPARLGGPPSMEDSLVTFVIQVTPVSRDGRVGQTAVPIPLQTFVFRDGFLQQLDARTRPRYPDFRAGWVSIER
jgi:hypothetical protein